MRRTSQKGRRRLGRRHAAAAIWSSVATISVVAAIVTALGDRGRERIAELFDDAPRPAQIAVGVTEDDIDRLSEQLARLRSEMRILGLENNALATKMASMEAQQPDPITTASVPDVAEHQARFDRGPRQVYPPKPGQDEPIALEFEELPLEAVPDGAHDELEPDSVMSGIADLAAPEARVAQITTNASQFALEIGSAATIDELEQLWGILSREHSAVLEELAPRYGVASDEDGERRLLLRAGPIGNIADAMNACAAMRGRGAACSPVSYAGQVLVMQ